jgi:saccharopine dehydrogenase (NADP+, L-glutamate forming)
VCRSIIARVDELCSYADDAERERIISGLRWIGLFSDEPAKAYGTPIDTLCGQLEKSMSFQPGEQDLVMLQHTFVVEWKDGTTETFTSTLELLGDPKGYSGMSKSVGVTCGIATQLLLDGHPAFTQAGLLAPYVPEMCTPIRDLLVQEDIVMVEKRL